MSNTKKSPLTDKPLRYPGQSLDESINKILDDDVLEYILMPTICIMLTLLEWWRWYNDSPYTPYLWTLLTLVIIPFSIFKIYKIKKKIKQLRLGRDGERVVGQYLELLREQGYRVFHDIVGNDFNIDHVVISEKGVYVIETKTYSKPSEGKPVIRHQSDQIIIDGFNTGEKIITQVKAASNWLNNVIKESTGKNISVKPVVVFPGWFVETKSNTKDVWVINPKGLPAFINNAPTTLTKDEMMMVSYHISRYIRSV